MTDKPFIDGNIWEVKQWPRAGKMLNLYCINDIYYYNSITSNREDKKQSVFIQIPERLIDNIEGIKLVTSNLEKVIRENIPVIERIGDDSWEVNTEILESGKYGEIQR